MSVARVQQGISYDRLITKSNYYDNRICSDLSDYRFAVNENVREQVPGSTIIQQSDPIVTPEIHPCVYDNPVSSFCNERIPNLDSLIPSIFGEVSPNDAEVPHPNPFLTQPPAICYGPSEYPSTIPDYNNMINQNKGRINPNGLLSQLNLPCQQIEDWDYNNCYSFYANGCLNTCRFVDAMDIEDFMNNEKRKEKSRDAARCRRSRETEIFTDLAHALPLTKDQISQLDKASVMRLAISYLRVREMVKLVPQILKKEDDLSTSEDFFLKSLDGFLFVVSADGDIIYSSENVAEYLGITQVDLMGQNLYEYSHPCDHEEFKEILSARSSDDSDESRSFFVRLKCTLTSKGRSVNLKSATYKVIHFTGHFLQRNKLLKKGNDSKSKSNSSSQQRCLAVVGQPIPHPSNIEAPLGKNTFLTKHGLDMKFTYADDIMVDFLGYNPKDLIGKSIYQYHHALDSDGICSAYKSLFSKGQCETSRYRFLAKTGGYVWVLTQATLIHDKLQKPQSVVCVNYVISGIECEDEIYSSAQLLSSVKTSSPKKELCPKVFKEESLPELILPPQPPIRATPKVHRPQAVTAKLFGEPVNQSPPPPPLHHPPPLVRPQTATFKIFAPRTEDMSKGFLTFSEEEPGLTLLKDEPDDLTHLAPVAGDVCIPLEDHPFLTDVLDEFFLKDNFAPLLNDEPSDPFISYRDSCDPSPQLLSPNTASKSSDSSMSSLSSPGGEPLSEEDRMSSFMTLQLEDDDPDLLMKAPYIPMDMGDDLPLLIPDDLVWNSSADKKCAKEMEKAPADVNSSLAQLLCSSSNKHGPKSIDKGGGNSMQIDYDSFPEDKKCNWASSKSSVKKERHSNDSFGNKRTNSSSFGAINNKRIKSESKEKMSPELLQQLMLNNTQRGKSKGKSNWLLDSGQKAACISQPSDSVLMNLLNEPNDMTGSKIVEEKLTGVPFDRNRTKPPDTLSPHQFLLRKNSLSLLDPEATSIASLLDLTRQDYEVNAPVNSLILQGEELLKALEGSPHLAGVQ